jgi:hypothetical protein
MHILKTALKTKEPLIMETLLHNSNFFLLLCELVFPVLNHSIFTNAECLQILNLMLEHPSSRDKVVEMMLDSLTKLLLIKILQCYNLNNRTPVPLRYSSDEICESLNVLASVLATGNDLILLKFVQILQQDLNISDRNHSIQKIYKFLSSLGNTTPRNYCVKFASKNLTDQFVLSLEKNIDSITSNLAVSKAEIEEVKRYHQFSGLFRPINSEKFNVNIDFFPKSQFKDPCFWSELIFSFVFGIWATGPLLFRRAPNAVFTPFRFTFATAFLCNLHFNYELTL